MVYPSVKAGACATDGEFIKYNMIMVIKIILTVGTYIFRRLKIWQFLKRK
jgi:hypothetical protein